MLFKRYSNTSEQGDVKLCECVNSISQVKLNVYSYYQDGVLIDCGAHALRNYFMPFYKSLEIERAVITHAHEDHDGCANYLHKMGIPIYINEMSLKKVKEKQIIRFIGSFFGVCDQLMKHCHMRKHFNRKIMIGASLQHQDMQQIMYRF